MEFFLSLLIIFGAVAFIPLFSKGIRLPVIVIELILGIILGVSVFNIIPHENSTIEFFSSFGLVYLMFLGGLEINLKSVQKYFPKTIFIALSSVILPFLAGYFLGEMAQVEPLLLGTIFCTTSLGLVLPFSKEINYKHSFLQILLTSVVIVDVISIFLLAFTMALLDGSLTIKFAYSFLTILILFLLPLLGKTKIMQRVVAWLEDKSHFELEVRISFALIFLLTAVTEELGFHSIIGAFIAGLLISEITANSTPILKRKLEGFGYGFFIPLFFIFVGSKVDIPSLFSNVQNILLMLATIFFALASKIFAVSIVSKLQGFTNRESLAMGFSHCARLSLLIAASEIAKRAGYIDSNIFSIFVVLAIVSAIFGPIMSMRMLHNANSDEPVLNAFSVEKEFLFEDEETDLGKDN